MIRRHSARWRRWLRPAWLGTLRRTRPLSDHWGFDRGTPIDRYYIERFLDRHRADIHGRVLEVKDSSYSRRFGSAVDTYDVVDIDRANRDATVIADLTAADDIPSDTYDCFILTQVLQFVFDTRAAIAHAHRILKPGGVLLVTVPAVSRNDRHNTDYWRFTAESCRALFGAAFDADPLDVTAHGNVLTAIGFLMGMACEELTADELAVEDERYPLLITVRAEKR